MYYLCSENKGADQLRSYCAADLPLCFRICKKRFSHNEAHIIIARILIFRFKASKPVILLTLAEVLIPQDQICTLSDQSYHFFSTAASETQIDDAKLAIERYLMSRIYTHAMFPNGDGDVLRDQYV